MTRHAGCDSLFCGSGRVVQEPLDVEAGAVASGNPNRVMCVMRVGVSPSYINTAKYRWCLLSLLAKEYGRSLRLARRRQRMPLLVRQRSAESRPRDGDALRARGRLSRRRKTTQLSDSCAS